MAKLRADRDRWLAAEAQGKTKAPQAAKEKVPVTLASLGLLKGIGGQPK